MDVVNDGSNGAIGAADMSGVDGNGTGGMPDLDRVSGGRAVGAANGDMTQWQLRWSDMGLQ